MTVNFSNLDHFHHEPVEALGATVATTPRHPVHAFTFSATMVVSVVDIDDLRSVKARGASVVARRLCSDAWDVRLTVLADS